MTAALSPKTCSTSRDERLGERLEPIHRACLRDLRAFVGAVTAKDRDIWARWNAIRYVDTVFSGRFDRERHAIEELRHTLPAEDVDRLWVNGELVGALRWQLRNSVGLCHHGAEFAEISSKLLRAVQCWFVAVSTITGNLAWEALPAGVQDDIGFLGKDTAPTWRALPVSLVTSL